MTILEIGDLRVLIFSAGLLLAAAVGSPVFGQTEDHEGTAEPQRERVVLGALSYRLHCLSCHGSTGTGDGPMAELLKTAPNDLTLLTEEAGGEFPAERVYRTIDGREEIRSHGSREMPVWGIGFQDLGRDSEQEAAVRDRILDLVAYLKTLQVDDQAESP